MEMGMVTGMAMTMRMGMVMHVPCVARWLGMGFMHVRMHVALGATEQAA